MRNCGCCTTGTGRYDSLGDAAAHQAMYSPPGAASGQLDALRALGGNIVVARDARCDFVDGSGHIIADI
jgi:hypothetical protein